MVSCRVIVRAGVSGEPTKGVCRTRANTRASGWIKAEDGAGSTAAWHRLGCAGRCPLCNKPQKSVTRRCARVAAANPRPLWDGRGVLSETPCPISRSSTLSPWMSASDRPEPRLDPAPPSRETPARQPLRGHASSSFSFYCSALAAGSATGISGPDRRHSGASQAQRTTREARAGPGRTPPQPVGRRLRSIPRRHPHHPGMNWGTVTSLDDSDRGDRRSAAS